MTSTAIRPFRVDVPQAELDDLRDRLARTRWPDDYEGVGWDYGSDLATMKELATYWRDGYDWRRQEAYLNSFPHFTAALDGEELTFIHVRGTGPDPIPLLLLHGWPDSVCRYLKLIPLLTDPASHGGDPGICFDVVVPWLIGRYRGGSRAPRSGLFRHIAEQLWTLMTRELGYQRFGAAGGDGGSVLAQLLGVHHPDSILGAHLTDLGFTITFAQFPDLSEAEQRYFAELQGWSMQEGAYAMVQGTKPQTLAFGLSDSPVGFAAWIIEKFRTWSDCDGRLENVYTKDELLTNVMLYWLNGPTARSVSYREEFTSPSLAPNQQVGVPSALAVPPKDLGPIMPRELAARNLTDLRRYTVLPHGGHFAAMEYPDVVAQDVRAFFADLPRG
ncbi:MAG TPA: epoxide hydrolase [Actinomycetota bacterium]|jgi:microsomal epoxide hydrolase|nr:epoxide hydrolase [Actinomycetota bacterium]